MLCAPFMVFAADNEELKNVHQELADKFDEVSHMSADQLDRLPSDQVVLIDVREVEEYAVSHLENAIQVDPDISNRKFMQRFESSVKDKIVIFYCSVGYRSSDLAEDVQDRLIQSGARAVYNLKQGIFGWHNAEMPVVNEAGNTARIHPYDDYWGRLINRRGEVSYKLVD